jgi:hypothetical protein
MGQHHKAELGPAGRAGDRASVVVALADRFAPAEDLALLDGVDAVAAWGWPNARQLDLGVSKCGGRCVMHLHTWARAAGVVARTSCVGSARVAWGVVDACDVHLTAGA